MHPYFTDTRSVCIVAEASTGGGIVTWRGRASVSGSVIADLTETEDGRSHLLADLVDALAAHHVLIERECADA